MDRIPCRVSQDLRRYQSEQDQLYLNAPEFDAWDIDCIREVVRKELAGPIQNILLLDQRGLSGVSLNDIEEAIRDLHDAIKEEWGNA